MPTTTQTGPAAEPTRLRAAARRAPGPKLAGLALAILCAIALAVILHAGRNESFRADDWEFLLHRRGTSPGTFLRPHVDHPSVLPVAEYKLLLQVFGMGSYTPFRLVVALAHILTGVLLYLYARPRLGAWLALLPAALMLFLGAAWEDLTWAFQIGFVGAVTLGLAALLALDARRDALACLALLASTCCSALAVPFIVISAVKIAGERRWPRAWVLAPAVVLFAIVRWGYGYAGEQPWAPFGKAVPWGLDMAAAGVGGVFGLGVDWGRPLLLVAAAALYLAFRREPARRPQLVALLCGAGVFWLLTGLGRANLGGINPEQSRYIYLSGALVLLLAVTAMPRPRVVTRGGGIALAAGTLVVCLVGVGLLDDGAQLQAADGQLDRVDLAALDVARGHVEPGFQVDSPRAPDILAGSYYSARDAFGTPAVPLPTLRRAAEGTRETFDAALIAALRLHLGPAPAAAGGGAAPAARATGGQLTIQGGCVRFQPATSGAQMELTLPPGGTSALTATGGTASLLPRRLAAGPAPDAKPLLLAAGTTASLALPRDALPDPWHVQVTASAPVRVCSA